MSPQCFLFAWGASSTPVRQVQNFSVTLTCTKMGLNGFYNEVFWFCFMLSILYSLHLVHFLKFMMLSCKIDAQWNTCSFFGFFIRPHTRPACQLLLRTATCCTVLFERQMLTCISPKGQWARCWFWGGKPSVNSDYFRFKGANWIQATFNPVWM